MNFAQIAKDLREETGLSQKKLGEKLGLSSSGIAHLELAQREPTSSTLLAYAKYFDVTTDYLLGLEGVIYKKISPPLIKANGDEMLSREEREIIKKFRELNASGKKLINQTIETLLTTTAKSDKKRKFD